MIYKKCINWLNTFGINLQIDYKNQLFLLVYILLLFIYKLFFFFLLRKVLTFLKLFHFNNNRIINSITVKDN